MEVKVILKIKSSREESYTKFYLVFFNKYEIEIKEEILAEMTDEELRKLMNSITKINKMKVRYVKDDYGEDEYGE